MAHNFYNEKYEQIVNELGGVNPENEFSCYAWHFTYKGFKMSLQSVKDKIKISVFLPDRNTRSYNSDIMKMWMEAKTTINVSNKFSPETIANSIKNRIPFDKLIHIKELFREKDEEYESMKSNFNDFVEEIAETLNLKPRSNNDLFTEFNLSNDKFYGDVKVHCSSVEFHIRGISDMNLIKKIAELIKK